MVTCIRLHALSALSSSVAQNAASQDAAREAGAVEVAAAMLARGGTGKDPVVYDLASMRRVLSALIYLTAGALLGLGSLPTSSRPSAC